MKLAVSYFYQIRNFKRNMIPLSTAIYDPKWYHDFTRDYNYLFKDKRGIVNGLRLLPVIECGRQATSCHGPQNCQETSNSPDCTFLNSYRNNLEQLSFEDLIHGLQDLEEKYKKKEHIDDEIIIVLIVYETPENPCSERKVLIDYFNAHGVPCVELEYPIK